VRLTLERDSVVLLQDKPPTSDEDNNNNKTAGDVASAADDSGSMLSRLSVNDVDTADGSCSPSPSPTSPNMHRNVKRRSTVPKGSVTVQLSLCA